MEKIAFEESSTEKRHHKAHRFFIARKGTQKCGKVA